VASQIPGKIWFVLLHARGSWNAMMLRLFTGSTADVTAAAHYNGARKSKHGLIELLRDRIVQSRWSLLAVGIVGPVLAALLLCTLGSLWPFRLDYRSLQDLHKLEGLGLPQSSGRFLFLSRDNGIESARTATFALRQMAFPDGSVDWAALKEACDGPWTSGFFGVDLDGQSYKASTLASGALSWSPDDGLRKLAVADTREAYLIFDSQATRQAFETRWPFLKQAVHVSVLPDTMVKAFVHRPFASEFTVARVVRIAAVMGTFFAVFLVLIQLPFLRRAPALVPAAAATFLALGLNIWLAYLMQWISLALVRWTPSLLWLVGLVAALSLSTRTSRWRSEEPPWQFNSLCASGSIALTFCILAYAVLFLARLDFDGDFFNNWLPQARFFYLLGRHDPSLIVQQGSMQAASYPPGYGILLSIVMWMTGMSPTASFLPGMDSSFAILIYRLLVLALNLSLFLLIAAYLKRLGTEKSALWIPALVILMLLIPTTAGKHGAAETILFPMLAASITLIAAGRRCLIDDLTVLGLLVGGMATLLKWEAGLIFAVGVLPWLFPLAATKAGHLSKSSIVGWPAVAALACLPTLIWKTTLPIHSQFFGSVDKARLLVSAHQFTGLAGAAARIMLEDGRLILFLLVLPCALVFQLRAKPRWPAFLVPASIAALLIGWIAVFLFSNLPPQTYLETSYSRLIMIPTFSAILYCADALIDWSGTGLKSNSTQVEPVPTSPA
jgi:hypothetical protein